MERSDWRRGTGAPGTKMKRRAEEPSRGQSHDAEEPPMKRAVVICRLCQFTYVYEQKPCRAQPHLVRVNVLQQGEKNRVPLFSSAQSLTLEKIGKNTLLWLLC